MSGLCNDTVVSLYKQFQERAEDNLQITDDVIGGENIFVQIDECKLGKLKYYRGHTVQGAWVLGGVEDTAEFEKFTRMMKKTYRGVGVSLQVATLCT